MERLRVRVFERESVLANPDSLIPSETRYPELIETKIEPSVWLRPGVVEWIQCYFRVRSVRGAIACRKQNVKAVARAKRNARTLTQHVRGVPGIEEFLAAEIVPESLVSG